jgi:cation transport regulator ChaC
VQEFDGTTAAWKNTLTIDWDYTGRWARSRSRIAGRTTLQSVDDLQQTSRATTPLPDARPTVHAERHAPATRGDASRRPPGRGSVVAGTGLEAGHRPGMRGSDTTIWIFGYGSLIWRPGIPYEERCPARLRGWVRRFWQGSHDHRGLPHAPGRVVTLVAQDGGYCDGMAYRVAREVATQVFEGLDYREKNGYRRETATLELFGGGTVEGVVYVAPQDNHAFLGPAPVEIMARQIHGSRGPSGPNLEYVLELAKALRDMGASDAHVFELEDELRKIAGSELL